MIHCCFCLLELSGAREHFTLLEPTLLLLCLFLCFQGLVVVLVDLAQHSLLLVIALEECYPIKPRLLMPVIVSAPDINLLTSPLSMSACPSLPPYVPSTLPLFLPCVLAFVLAGAWVGVCACVLFERMCVCMRVYVWVHVCVCVCVCVNT